MSSEEPDLLPDLDSEVLYEGWGREVLDELVEPALGCAQTYDRLTGYFTLESMLAVATGIDGLWRQGGEMRLVLGIHDVPPEIIEAEELSESDVPAMVEAVRERLLEEVSTIEEEFQRDKLATLAWMMSDGLLQVRVACPLSHTGLQRSGIFHKKRLIFTDSEGHTMVAVGSPNETVAGFQENIEELTVFRSWEDGQLPFIRRHTESFEAIWDDEREYLEVVEMDDSFADDLLDRLGSPSRPPNATERSTVDVGDVLETARQSPAYAVLSFDSVGLYPHQERVFVEGLSRWPVRVLLADEVGLGKTLEAGAILSYLLRFEEIEEATILAPANLIKQWQEELHLHFGLEFWRWDSSERVYVSPDGESWEGALDGNPIGADAPEQVLISSQLARGTKKRGHIYEEADRFPDVLMVDEAHAARVRPSLDGSVRPTRLWRTLDDIADQIPHIVFMTATPLQTNLQEYHALLSILGLPGLWDDLDAYERSLEILSKGPDAASLRNSQRVLRLIEASLERMGFVPDSLSEEEKNLIELARHTDGNPGLDAAMDVMDNWSTAYELLVRLHPAHLLTLRNSRTSLVERGYRFPERRFESPALDTPKKITRFYEALHEYLWEAYGRVEKAADPDREISLGFAKSSYHQRTASSLHAARCSLQNRLEKIENIVEGDDADAELLEVEYEEPDLDDEGGQDREMDVGEQQRLENAKTIESAYIEDLLGGLPEIREDSTIQDPKMETMTQLLDNHLPEEGTLVFSRYTDTIDACLRTYRRNRSGNLEVGYGLYTGDNAWIHSGGERTPATKQDVRLALEDGDIGLVFCSEAAAEGLNLQAARVMINIDVPWNPAKVEQRIGRIARLGQPADEVLIYNLWYPDSVEEKMYRRLTDRKDLYDIAVGQSPEIVSNAIRSLVSGDGNQDGIETEEAFEELGEIRQSTQHRAIQEVWGPIEDSIPTSTKVRREFLEVLADYAPGGNLDGDSTEMRLEVPNSDEGWFEAGSEPESRSILTLNHDIFEVLSGARGVLPPDTELLVLEETAAGRPVALCLERDDSIAIVPPSDLPTLLATLMRRDSVDGFLDADDWNSKSEMNLVAEVRNESRWLPDHGNMDVPFETSDVDVEHPMPSIESDRLNLRPL